MNIWESLRTMVEAEGDWAPEIPASAKRVLSKLDDPEMKAVLSALHAFRDDNAVIQTERDIVAKVLEKMHAAPPESIHMKGLPQAAPKK